MPWLGSPSPRRRSASQRAPAKDSSLLRSTSTQNPIAAGAGPTWTSSGGTFSPSKGASTTFTAGSVAGASTVTATQAGVHGSASVAIVANAAFSSPQTMTAGQSSSAMTLRLTSSAPNGGLSISLATNTAAGGFSTSSTGPFASALSVTVQGGSTVSRSFYYRDTKAGSPVVTASGQYVNSVSQTETITAGALTHIAVSPSSVSLTEGTSKSLAATAVDQYTNPVSTGLSPTWTSSGGTFSPSKGTSTTYTAGSVAGANTVTATQAGVRGSASVTIMSNATFALTPQTITAGQSSAALTLSLPSPAPTGGLSISLSTNTSAGGFSTTSTGTFGHTLSVSVASGSTVSGAFYYKDTKAESPVVTASGQYVNSVSQTETITAATVAHITVTPSSVSLTEGASQALVATAVDQYTNPVGAGLSPTWASSGGTFSPSKGASTTFTAGSVAGSYEVTVTQSGVHVTVPVTISAMPTPAAIVNSSTWMNTFYDNSGSLMNAWWQSTSGWHDQVLATGMTGSPAAIVNSSTWMNVFYDSSSGQLMNEWWQSTSGWHNQVLASGMVGSPKAITRTSTSMDVFYESTSGQLDERVVEFDQRLACPGVGNGDGRCPCGGGQQRHLDERLLPEHLGPTHERLVAVGQRLARAGTGHRHGRCPGGCRQQRHLDGRLLREHLGPAHERLVAVNERVARPGTGQRCVRHTHCHRTHSDIDGRLLPAASAGQLINEWWNAKTGWHNQALASGLAGAPTAAANSATWMDVFYLNTAGKYVNAWWQSTSGWHVQSLF